MHRRTAAFLLCGPLVAGCGAATRMHFAGHSRPASPLEVSVYVGGGGVQLDPRRITPGPVQLNIANQSGRTVTVTVMNGAGHRLSSSPRIPAGGTAQLKTQLGHGSFGIGVAGRPATTRLLALRGRPRTGDSSLQQP